MPLIPDPPNNFRVTSKDSSPPTVNLGWDTVSDSDLRQDYHIASTFNHLTPTANATVNPQSLSAHTRTVQGYSLYRNNTSSFDPPSSGTKLADENDLGPGDDEYSDTDLSAGQVKFYKLNTRYKN